MRPADLYEATGRVLSPLSSDDESDVSVCDSDPDLTQTYSLPSSILEAVEARRGRVGGLSEWG